MLGATAKLAEPPLVSIPLNNLRQDPVKILEWLENSKKTEEIEMRGKTAIVQDYR